MKKIEARYEGRCPACREPIEVGDDLALEDDQPAVHYECAGERPRAGLISREVCPSCFIEKFLNGACACDEDDE